MVISRTESLSVRQASPLLVRIAVAAALAGTGLVHLLLASTYGSGSAVVGAAFVLGGVVAFLAGAWLLIADSAVSWDLAAAVSAGMLAALVISSTVGLFGIKTDQIQAPHAVSILTEVSVLIAWAATRLRHPDRGRS